MLTVIMIMVLTFILTYVLDKSRIIEFCILISLISGLLGCLLAVALPKDTTTSTKTYKLQRIGNSYVNLVSEGYAIMYNSRMEILPRDYTEVQEGKTESSVIIKETRRADTVWNYFTIDGNRTEYIIQLKTL